MVGVAVKVTLLPAHMEFVDAAIETEATTTGFTVIVILFDVAGLPLVQLALDVR